MVSLSGFAYDENINRKCTRQSLPSPLSVPRSICSNDSMIYRLVDFNRIIRRIDAWRFPSMMIVGRIFIALLNGALRFSRYVTRWNIWCCLEKIRAFPIWPSSPLILPIAADAFDDNIWFQLLRKWYESERNSKRFLFFEINNFKFDLIFRNIKRKSHRDTVTWKHKRKKMHLILHLCIATSR